MTPRSAPLRLGILVLILGIVLAACGADDPDPTPVDGHPATLAGTAWRVVSIVGQRPAAGTEPAIAFDATIAKGSGGCNTFSGTYRYDRTGALAFGDLAMTAMACLEAPRNALETAFMRALGGVNLVSINALGLLVLSGSAGEILLADAAHPNPTD
jgi:heat shock protein HslJ